MGRTGNFVFATQLGVANSIIHHSDLMTRSRIFAPCQPPILSIFAFTVNFLCMFEAGARNILVPSPRPIQNLQRAFENYPVTWVTGVNTLFNALLNEEWFTAYPPKHLKAAGGGGAAMHHAVV